LKRDKKVQGIEDKYDSEFRGQCNKNRGETREKHTCAMLLVSNHKTRAVKQNQTPTINFNTEPDLGGEQQEEGRGEGDKTS
jgi:hypothetical protein